MFSRRHTVQQRENCTLQSGGEETMEEFRVETLKALWQAFDSLDTGKTGLVHVSQLKVITSNIGMKMGIEKGEELLNQDGVLSMDFNTYFDIVNSKLISKVDSEDPSKKSIGERMNSIIKTCWTFCNFERLHKSRWLSFDHCLVLWRLFNFLSETDDSGEPVVPIVLHTEEANMLLKHFVEETGQKNKEQTIKESLSELSGDYMGFADFLNVFEKDCVTNLSKGDITNGLNHLQDTYILNILRKGMLWKRGFKVKNWKERFFVMTPKQMKYYVSSNEKVLKGDIAFDSDCTVEILPDRVGHKHNRFLIHTPKKPYEMSAPDMKSKNEWVSGLGMAFDRVGKDFNVQKEAARERCRERMERKRQALEEEQRRREEAEHMRQQAGELDEERRKRLEDEELLRKRLLELEEERRLREEAEARALEEQALKEAEMQKLRELEEIKRELERLLEEERQAKRDEEIVRNLQSKLLDEEFQRREELELLKQQQDEMLRSEREQKAILQSDRQDQERALREAQQRLEQLEQERTRADQQMQEAREKLQRAEKDRRIMEDKVKLWKTPVGLAKLITPTANPFVTHRGQGAFSEKEFIIRAKLNSEPAPRLNYDQEEDDTKTSESECTHNAGKAENDKEQSDDAPEETHETDKIITGDDCRKSESETGPIYQTDNTEQHVMSATPDIELEDKLDEPKGNEEDTNNEIVTKAYDNDLYGNVTFEDKKESQQDELENIQDNGEHVKQDTELYNEKQEQIDGANDDVFETKEEETNAAHESNEEVSKEDVKADVNENKLDDIDQIGAQITVETDLYQ